MATLIIYEGILTVSQVPEPTTITLLASGILGFVASRRKTTQVKT
jgi:hypothetical protein